MLHRPGPRTTHALLLALLFLPLPFAAEAATDEDFVPMQPMAGTPAGQSPENQVVFAKPTTQGMTSGRDVVFVVQCAGPCGGSEGPLLDFQFRRADDQVHQTYSSTATTPVASASGTWYNYTFTLRLPRAHAPYFRVHLREANGEFASDWMAAPGVIGALATFTDAGTTTVRRGEPFRVKSTTSAYFGNAASFGFDPDAWDQLPIQGDSPQKFTWNLGPAGIHSFPVTTPADLATIALNPQMTTLTRDGCIPFTVTVDDSAGQAAEGAAYRAWIEGAYFDPTSAPAAMLYGPATHVVEHACVQNAIPTFSAGFLPDPVDATMGAFVFGQVTDPDHARGFDKLVFAVHDRTGTGANLLGAWDWDQVRAAGMIRIPLASLVGGTKICLIDYERNAILGGQPVSNLPNTPIPPCAVFQNFTSQPHARGMVRRFVLEPGAQDATHTTLVGSLRETRRSLPYLPADPQGVVPAVTAALQAILAEGSGPDTTTMVVLTLPNLPSNPELNGLITNLTARGVLLVVPAGTPSWRAQDTPHWEIQGVAAHPEALSVGAASADGTRVRADSAFGPSPLLRQKPDVTVRVADALDAQAAQAAAVRYASELALWYQLRGITEPRMVKALVRQQALPVHTLGSLGTSSSTGSGALDPARFSSNPTALNPANLPTADLDATATVAGGTAVVPFPVSTPDAVMDVGVVNRARSKTGALALENPNGLLRHSLETHTASIAARLAQGANPYAAARVSPNVTVNVTFYSLLDMLAHNFTDAQRAQELRDRVADLDASRVAAGQPDPFALSAEERAVVTGWLAGGDAPRAWHFIPQKTVTVPPSTYVTSCRPPSLEPLRYHVQAAIAYVTAVQGAWATTALSQALAQATSASWENCASAVDAVQGQIASVLGIIDARVPAFGPEPFLALVRQALVEDAAAIATLATGSVGRAMATNLSLVPLATDPARTQLAPEGPYVGVVRVTTHNQCVMALTGTDAMCRDATEHSLATLMLVGDTSFVLRDRSGRPMPGRPVTLQHLPIPQNCAGGPSEAHGPRLANLALADLFHAAPSFAAVTDAQGIARFPWVPPGYYDLHDGFVGFAIHGVWDTANGTGEEHDGFVEADCHPPLLVRGGLDATLGAVLDAAQLLPCAKAASRGLPVTSVLGALDAHAAGPPAGCASSLNASAAQGLASRLRDALQESAPAQAWQIVFPQVQQARLVDAVHAQDVATQGVGSPPAPAWTFLRDGTRVTAVGAPLTRQFAAFQYSYALPPNEELAMKWRFTANLSNTAGLAIFTIRDDLPAVLDALASRQPGDVLEAATQLRDLVGGAAMNGAGGCSPAAHYRIIPLVPLAAAVDVEEPQGGQGAKAGVSVLGTQLNVSRHFRFHTRECPATMAHAAFVFFPTGLGLETLLSPGTSFSVQDQHLWTWSALGNPARDCPGDWCLLKLEDEEAMQQPVGMSTMEASAVALDVSAFDPKIEGWDSFVDLMNDTRVLSSPSLPSSAIPDLLWHPNHEDAADMGTAPAAAGAAALWLEEAALTFTGAALDPQGSRILASGGWVLPDRNAGGNGASGDYVRVDWSQGGTSGSPPAGPPAGATDASPNQAHSPAVQATGIATGRFGGAFRFDGNNQYIEVPQANFAMPSGTVMMWVNPASRAPNAGRLFYHQSPGFASQLLVNLDGAGRVQFQVGSSAQNTLSSTTTVPLNQWSHVAVTWTPERMRVFINGQAAGEMPHSGRVEFTYSRTWIGNTPYAPWNGGFVGALDDVREYGVALDAGLVASLMAGPYQGVGGLPSQDPRDLPRLVGHERFVYVLDAAAPSAGHFLQKSLLGLGQGFTAGADPLRALGFDDLLSPAPVKGSPRPVAPSWANRPDYRAPVPPTAYSHLLHAPRDVVAAHRGAWSFLEDHPRAGTPPPAHLPVEGPWPTPMAPWVAGTNTQRHTHWLEVGVPADPGLCIDGGQSTSGAGPQPEYVLPDAGGIIPDPELPYC